MLYILYCNISVITNIILFMSYPIVGYYSVGTSLRHGSVMDALTSNLRLKLVLHPNYTVLKIGEYNWFRHVLKKQTYSLRYAHF